MRTLRLTVLALALWPALSVTAGLDPVQSAEVEYTYADLVTRMMDLASLSELPRPGETCRQWSSYDRASRFDSNQGRYVAWDANGDGGQFIRREGDQVVMAEMKGPGCIWRIWSALAKEGHVKIYLDGQPQPAVDLPFRQYFTGKTKPFDYPNLSYQLEDVGCRGHNLYLPIPYQKSCKIVADKDWGAYYQFVYTTFPEGTKVPTFTANYSPDSLDALKRLNRCCGTQGGGVVGATMGADPMGPRDGEETIADSISIAAGATERLQLTGARAITAIRGMLDLPDREQQMAALRELVLAITFDDRETPSVWCPLGDFFGTAPGINYYKSLVTGMTEEGGYAFWYMPFAKQATIELRNEGTVDRELSFEIVHAPLQRPFEGLGHFHAKWHRDAFVFPADRAPDWGILQTDGRGRFCGVMLHVWNPRGGWWGEGDEKFFVDGEKFPSTFGTGSEDYFGYAWCHPGLFQYAYHCQTMTENNKGHQSVLRWHIADNIPFQTSFEACIEKYYPNDRGTLYACVPCFYLDPGSSDPLGTVAVENRHGYYVKPPPGGAGFRVVGEIAGTAEEQGMHGYGPGKWQDDNQLWWTGAEPGDRLPLQLTVKNSGRFDVIVKLTKAVDYAIVQFYVDDQKAGEPIDLFNKGVIPSGPVSLGVHNLNEGDHTLTVEIVGANEEAVKAYMFGIDQVLLEPR